MNDSRLCSARKGHARAVAVLFAAALLATGCTQKPIKPVPYEQANTAAWFSGSDGYPMREWYKSAYEEGRQDYANENYAAAIRKYRDLAEKGVGPAAYELGKAYRYGYGVPQNPRLAAEWLMAAVSRSHTRWPHASYHLGTMFLEGEGVPRDVGLARRLLQQAHDNGYARAALPLAQIYAEGIGVEKNVARAQQLAHQSAQTGDIGSYLWLLKAYQPDGSFGDNPQRATSLSHQAVTLLKRHIDEEGDPRAMRDLAMIYFEGLGRPRDPDTAIGWLHQAARAGRPDYLVNLGEDLLNGTDGYKADPRLGFAMVKAAADRYRDPEAMTLVGEAYRDGRGTSRSVRQAEDWFRRAVDAGSVKAQLEYGRMLVAREDRPAEVRRGVALLQKASESKQPYAWAELGELHVDRAFPGAAPSKGVDYLRRAHRAGIRSATADLGEAYLDGKGVRKNAKQAEALLKQAAESGDPGAMIALGRGYMAGTVLARRPDEAQRWLERAEKSGIEDARLILGRAMLAGEIPGTAEQGRDIVEAYARQGNTHAMMELGRAYRDGFVIAENHDMARFWFEKAMAANEPDAKATLAAMLFADGNREPPVVGKLTQAAELGHAGAMSVLGQAYLQGEGVEPSVVQGTVWLQRAVDAGNMNAAATLGSAYLWGDYGLDHDPEKGRAMLENAITSGDPSAQRELGYALVAPGESGLSAAPGRGLQLLKTAANKGDVYAMELLGLVYLEGTKGVSPRPGNAEVWLKRAAESGDVSSMTALGSEYISGDRLDRDLKAGLSYLQKGARAGDDTARAELGRMYTYGNDGVAPDPERGFELLKKAAANGHPGGMAALGRAYVNGAYGEKRIDEGARLLFRAVRAGHESARYALAEAFLKSHGLRKANRDYAEAWMRTVAAGHTEVAVRTLTEMLREGDVTIPELDNERKTPKEMRNEKS